MDALLLLQKMKGAKGEPELVTGVGKVTGPGSVTVIIGDGKTIDLNAYAKKN